MGLPRLWVRGSRLADRKAETRDTFMFVGIHLLTPFVVLDMVYGSSGVIIYVVGELCYERQASYRWP